MLNDGRIGKWEFTKLQTFQLGALDDLCKVDHKMEAEARTQLQKSLLNEINDLKKAVKKSKASRCVHSSLVLSRVLPQCKLSP